MLTTGGNHEVQSAENFVPYQLRYPTPYLGSSSPDPTYYGREVGPLHIIALNSYANTSAAGFQYEWLENYLETRVNRERTPWLVLMMHSPWYSSNTVHWMEGELTRRSMEPLIYKYGVDLVISGHVHSYERTFSTYDNELDPCGPVYVVIGDGGNYEGPANPWRVEDDTESGAPVWSAFRESSFGIGGFEIFNSTHAYFSWHRNACGSDSESTYYMNFSTSCVTPGDNSINAMETSDTFWVIRPSVSQCENKAGSSSYEPESTVSSSSSNSKKDLSSTEISLTILCSILGAIVVILLFVVFALYQKVGNISPQLLQGKSYSSASDGRSPTHSINV